MVMVLAHSATLRRFLYAAAGLILAALLATVGVLWYRKGSSNHTAVSAARPSIAVLALQNLSTEPDSNYFSDGMADEISTKLSKIQGVDVVSRSVVTSLKASDKTPADIGHQLGVRYLLEGSVRKVGTQVRVNVQLIDPSTGFQTWADDFTGDMQNVFSLQEQAALKIAEALNVHLSPQEQREVMRRYTQNAHAYEEFLIGRSLLVHEDQREALEAARKHFEAALKLDPNYAPALAGFHTSRVTITATSIPLPLISSVRSNSPTKLCPSIRSFLKRILPWVAFSVCATSTRMPCVSSG
jgi:TolB-like protein